MVDAAMKVVATARSEGTERAVAPLLPPHHDGEHKHDHRDAKDTIHRPPPSHTPCTTGVRFARVSPETGLSRPLWHPLALDPLEDRGGRPSHHDVPARPVPSRRVLVEVSRVRPYVDGQHLAALFAAVRGEAADLEGAAVWEDYRLGCLRPSR